jgi:acyl-CoA dehydrogenase
VAEDDDRAPLASAAAKAFATEAAVAACERSIQVHGGIGFTWEHPLHRFYKRAIWLEGFGARQAELRLEVAEAVLA